MISGESECFVSIKILIDLFHSWYQNTCILANSADHDKMPYDAAFHKGMYCLLRKKIFRERNILKF